jgi:hypothetical protein
MQLSLTETPETIKSISERLGLVVVTASTMLRELEVCCLFLSIRVKNGSTGNKIKMYYRADTPHLYPEVPIYKGELPFDDVKLSAMMGYTNLVPPKGVEFRGDEYSRKYTNWNKYQSRASAVRSNIGSSAAMMIESAP